MESITDFLLDLLGITEATSDFLLELGQRLVVFFTLMLLSLIVGRYTLSLVALVLRRFLPQWSPGTYEKLIQPLEDLFRLVGSLILVSFALQILRDYQAFYNFLRFGMDLAIVLSLAWLVSRLSRQLLRLYGIELIRRFGREIDEFLLVFETAINILIGIAALIAFAQTQNINLTALLASLGIGGLAVAFAAQKTLEQLLGTMVLYLDRPVIPGEYVHLWSWPAFPDGVLGRVESIGLRSTKVRVVAKGTLLIIPNSVMANLEVIENITRSKKVMVMLYLDFPKVLDPQEQALVEQVVQQSTNSVFGIDPGSTRLAMFRPEEKPGTRARVTFFILGSSEDSIQLRKRLLELANETISKKLKVYKIEFTTTEPTVYVDSPMTV